MDTNENTKNLFAATELIQKKLRAERIVKWIFGSMSVVILIPEEEWKDEFFEEPEDDRYVKQTF